ncbi:hypothetical protein BS50DRAFT_390078 [Corynespora cassiicola Philippines]|uniref:Uncharacterized protein n=1 Tax=Corynespora cassiicola Philippines TaxID=1448308 RepID=A0A2T2NQJ8_CORCC|nr:hypothetical protein BS50DRAFT_390078 [Corynespora cassiicola Philippines]
MLLSASPSDRGCGFDVFMHAARGHWHPLHEKKNMCLSLSSYNRPHCPASPAADLAPWASILFLLHPSTAQGVVALPLPFAQLFTPYSRPHLASNPRRSTRRRRSDQHHHPLTPARSRFLTWALRGPTCGTLCSALQLNVSAPCATRHRDMKLFSLYRHTLLHPGTAAPCHCAHSLWPCPGQSKA